MNSIRDLVGNLSGINSYAEEANRAVRDAVVNSGAQQALRSIQRDHRQIFEQAAQLTSVAEQARKASGIDDAFSQLREALNITSAQQSLLDRTSQKALLSVSNLTGTIAQRCAKEQSVMGLGSIAKNLLGLQPIRDSVSEAMAQLNAANSLSFLDGYRNQAAAQNEAVQIATSAYQKYFDGIGKQNQMLLDSVGIFAIRDPELASKIASLATTFSGIQGVADSEALTSFASNQKKAFSSLGSVIGSFASSIGSPSVHHTLSAASQGLSESSRRMIESVASFQNLAGQQNLSNIVSLVDFATARALRATSNLAITKPERISPKTRKRRSSKRIRAMQGQLRALAAVAHASEQVDPMQPMYDKLNALNETADRLLELGAATALAQKSWIKMLGLWVTILLMLAGLAQDRYLAGLKTAPVPVNYVTASGVNLRVGPSTTQSVITRLALNEVVEIKEKQGVWFQVVANSSIGVRIGWVHQRYLKTVQPDPSPTNSLPAP